MKKLFTLLLALVVMTFTMCKNQPSSAPSTPQEALAELIAGNERYASEKSIYPRSSMDRVAQTAPHQAPFAAVVGC
jgi:carbonic anhydrase